MGFNPTAVFKAMQIAGDAGQDIGCRGRGEGAWQKQRRASDCLAMPIGFSKPPREWGSSWTAAVPPTGRNGCASATDAGLPWRTMLVTRYPERGRPFVHIALRAHCVCDIRNPPQSHLRRIPHRLSAHANDHLLPHSLPLLLRQMPASGRREPHSGLACTDERC